jgi:hypothetical protein
MALITFKLTIAAQPPPPPPSFGPYKSIRTPPPIGSPHTHPLYLSLPLSSSTATAESSLCRCYIVVARPPHCRRAPVRLEPIFSTLPSLFCALTNELPCFRVAGSQTPASTPPCPNVLPSALPSVHSGPHDLAVVQRPWTWSTGFPLLK